MSQEISKKWGSVAEFEDRYEFDAAHIFGGQRVFNKEVLKNIREEYGEISPDVLLQYEYYLPPKTEESFENIKKSIAHHKERDRFCYVQSALGILKRDKLEEEIRRVFKTLKGKRWLCCTSHFVQNHCSVEVLEFAYNLIYQSARE